MRLTMREAASFLGVSRVHHGTLGRGPRPSRAPLGRALVRQPRRAVGVGGRAGAAGLARAARGRGPRPRRRSRRRRRCSAPAASTTTSPARPRPPHCASWSRASRCPPGQDREFLLDVLEAREALSSTGIGDGIAIPHVRNPILLHVEQPFVALAPPPPAGPVRRPRRRAGARALHGHQSLGVRSPRHPRAARVRAARRANCAGCCAHGRRPTASSTAWSSSRPRGTAASSAPPGRRDRCGPLFGGLGLIALGGVLAPAGRRADLGRTGHAWCVWIGALAAAVPAVRVLATGGALEWRAAVHLPGGDWVLGLDPLSSIFLLAILAVGAAAARYGVAYLARERGHLAVWFGHATLAALIVALAFVVLARAVVPFLVGVGDHGHHVVSTIVTEHDQAQTRRAGLLYLVSMHAGTLALFVMFALWSGAGGDWTFASLAAAAPSLPHGGLIFALATFGFGMKAGTVPLPLLAAPGARRGALARLGHHVGRRHQDGRSTACCACVVLAGGAPAWWGWTILAMGAASAVLGVLWALAPARHQAAARVPQRGEHRHHPAGGRDRRARLAVWASRARGARVRARP